VIELGSEFSTRDAGEAGAALLEEIEARLTPSPVNEDRRKRGPIWHMKR